MDEWAPIFQEHIDSPVSEEFDPSWPFKFKWGFDAQTGRFDMWKTQGGSIDGRPYHRSELTQLWGREPRVQDGDLLGVASYIPAERKLDGTVVAPPTMLFQAYYNKPIPQQAYDWVDQHFPGTACRSAKLAQDNATFAEWEPDLAKQSKMYKWVWNQDDGILIWPVSETSAFVTNQDDWHDSQIYKQWGRDAKIGKDFRGYAYPLDDDLDLVSYDPSIPPKAYAQVKAEFAKMFPNKNILLPNDRDADLGVTFDNDPAILSRRHAAAAFMQTAVPSTPEMPVEAPESVSNVTLGKVGSPVPDMPVVASQGRIWNALRKIAGVPVVGGSAADKDGAMVALFIPSDVGEKLKQKDGEPVEDMHITLAYFAEKAADRDDWDEVEKIVQTIAAGHDALSGKINGMGVFSNDVDVLWAAPSIPGLAELRDDVVEAVEDAGFTVSTDHGWAPHITLKYDFKGKLPKVDSIPLSLDSITFARGDNRKVFELDGGFQKETAFEDFENLDQWMGQHPTTGDRMEFGPQTWSGWKGAYRFTTDGENFLKEPEEDLREQGFGWHGGGHTDMENRFRSMHHTKGPLVSGWAIPTADEMGYGILAPSVGLLGPDEPQLHDLIKQLDDEFEKPCHFVNSWQDIVDPKRYSIYPEGGQMVGLSK